MLCNKLPVRPHHLATNVRNEDSIARQHCSPLGMTTQDNMISQQQNGTNKKLKQSTKKRSIHILFVLPYLFDSAAIFSSSFNSGASVNKTKARTVLTTYERCTVFQLIISIMVLTELVQHGHHAL
jgi:hypothetical protein